MQQRKVDFLIVGGGPAGYAAAVRARHLGNEVLLVEKDTLGGTCLNRGCIPTKSLLEQAGLYRKLTNRPIPGIELTGVELKYEGMVDAKDTVVSSLVRGLHSMMKERGVEILTGAAKFVNESIIVQQGEQEIDIRAEKVILATGTVPAHLPFCQPNGRTIFDSDSILEMRRLPESLVIIGGGVIGCEFASIFRSLGVSVTIVELTEGLLPGEDEDVRKTLLRELKKQKIKVLTQCTVKEVEEARTEHPEVRLSMDHKGKEATVTAGACLVAVGRRPVMPEGCDLESDAQGYVKVDDGFATSRRNVYAAGDVIGGFQLAHLAFAEGMAAVESACGQKYSHGWHVPRCVYTSPETASVGMTEKQAKEAFGSAVVGIFSLKGNGKAMILEENAGFCKVVAAPDHRVVGFHMVGPHATEMIAEAVVALERNLTLEAWSECIHPHPTVNEAVHESLLRALGLAFHN